MAHMTTETEKTHLAAPLGARVEGDGVTFAVFTSVADAVEVCLFDERGQETRRALDSDEGYIWRGDVPGDRTGRAMASAFTAVGSGSGPALQPGQASARPLPRVTSARSRTSSWPGDPSY